MRKIKKTWQLSFIINTCLIRIYSERMTLQFILFAVGILNKICPIDTITTDLNATKIFLLAKPQIFKIVAYVISVWVDNW